MKKQGFVLVFMLGLLGCSQTKHEILATDSLAVSQVDTVHRQSKVVKHVPEKPMIVPPQLTDNSLPAFPAQWSSLSAIPTHWIQLERDEKGYLVYDPCDGDTPSIVIERGKVTIMYQTDQPEVLSIDKFTRVKGNKAFYLRATNHELSADIQATIVSVRQKLVLWQMDFSWKGRQPEKTRLRRLMTPEPYVKTFRVVKFACSDVKEAKDIPFLPIEY